MHAALNDVDILRDGLCAIELTDCSGATASGVHVADFLNGGVRNRMWASPINAFI